MKTNRTAREMKKYDKDPIFDAVVDKMRSKGRGHFIISCGPWIHVENTVPNCYAIMFDGFISYKFELTKDNHGEVAYKAAEIRCTEWLTLPLIVGMTYTPERLIEIINKSV